MCTRKSSASNQTFAAVLGLAMWLSFDLDGRTCSRSNESHKQKGENVTFVWFGNQRAFQAPVIQSSQPISISIPPLVADLWIYLHT